MDSKELLQTQRSATSSLQPPVNIPNPTFDDDDDATPNGGAESSSLREASEDKDLPTADLPGLDDEIILTPKNKSERQQLTEEEGGNIVEGNMQINNKATIETSNNPDSTCDVINNPTGLQRRQDNGDRYTEITTIDVNQKEAKKLSIGKNPISLKTMMFNQKNHPDHQLASPKYQLEPNSGRSSINISAWHSRGPKNFLEVVKQQLDTQRPQISFYSKNPKNIVKGQKVVNSHYNSPHSRAHMNTMLNQNNLILQPHITVNGVTNIYNNIQNSGSIFSDNDLSFSKDLIMDPNQNLMMVMVKQINTPKEEAQKASLTPKRQVGDTTLLTPSPFNASQFQENFIQKMELQSQQQINLMGEIKEHNESLEGSPRREKKGTIAWIMRKRQSVAKVTMAFQGIEHNDKSAFLGQNNPFAKLESLAKDRQKRLSDRIGNPIVEYLKRREELQLMSSPVGENSVHINATLDTQEKQVSRVVHQNLIQNKAAKQKLSKTQAHNSPSSGGFTPYQITEHGSDFRGSGPQSPSVSSIEQTTMQKPVMIGGPVYYQVAVSALPALELPTQNQQLQKFHNTTGATFNKKQDRKNHHSVENEKSRAPVWLRGLPQKNEQPKMISKPQMLFPLEPPIDERSKNFNHTVHLDPAYLDASIIQSKGVKVRASMANFRAQKYLAYLQQKVNREKAKNILLRGDDLHTVLEIPLNIAALPIYTNYQTPQLHHPECKAVNQYQEQQHVPSNNNTPLPFSETFFSHEGGPQMLPVNGMQYQSQVKPSKGSSKKAQKSQTNNHTPEGRAFSPSLLILQQPCISKLPPLRTREISPRFNITIKDQKEVQTSRDQQQNSTIQQEMTFFNSKDNNATDDVMVVLQPPGIIQQEQITYGIGGSLHLSLERPVMSPIEQLQNQQAQPSNTPMPQSELGLQSFIKDLASQHKYMKKSKLVEYKHHQEQLAHQRTISQTMNKTAIQKTNSIKAKHFVGSGGFQRMLGEDYTFQHEHDIYEKMATTPGGPIKGLADEISSPNQSFISYTNRVRKGTQQQHTNNGSPQGKLAMLSSQGYRDVDSTQHMDVIDLQGHKLTFAHKEVLIKK